MRDPTRVPRLTEKIKTLWLAMNALPFSRLIEYLRREHSEMNNGEGLLRLYGKKINEGKEALVPVSKVDLFYLEDDRLETTLDDLIAKHQNPPVSDETVRIARFSNKLESLWLKMSADLRFFQFISIIEWEHSKRNGDLGRLPLFEKETVRDRGEVLNPRIYIELFDCANVEDGAVLQTIDALIEENCQ